MAEGTTWIENALDRLDKDHLENLAGALVDVNHVEAAWYLRGALDQEAGLELEDREGYLYSEDWDQGFKDKEVAIRSVLISHKDIACRLYPGLVGMVSDAI